MRGRKKPSPMATEWVEGRGCPSGLVNQQLTAEVCSATSAPVTPNTQSCCLHALFLHCPTPLTSSPDSPPNVHNSSTFTSRWVMPLDFKVIRVADRFRKLGGSLSSHRGNSSKLNPLIVYSPSFHRVSYRERGRHQVSVDTCLCSHLHFANSY